MSNLHRHLAPITEAAWAAIEDEVRTTFSVTVAGRRVVDVTEPKGPTFSALGTGHIHSVASPVDGVIAHQREVVSVIELRAPFTVSRQAVDDVERGSVDSDWNPVKDAARRIAEAEDRVVFSGVETAGIVGIEAGSSHPAAVLPQDPSQLPEAVAAGINTLRVAGVSGPYSLVLSADAYTSAVESNDHGYPIRKQVEPLLDGGEMIWAPALNGGLLLSTRGGDFELQLGEDLAVGYLAHDATEIQLYLRESLTFRVVTPESGVVLN